MYPTNENRVKTTIKQLKDKTPSRFDAVSVEILKSVINKITPVMVILINKLLGTRELPDLKKSIVTSILINLSYIKYCIHSVEVSKAYLNFVRNKVKSAFISFPIQKFS